MIRSSKKTRARRRLQAQADAECRQAVFERDIRCVKCGNDRNLQWAHIIGRRDKVLRCDPLNSVVFCAGCHLWWHHQPLEAVFWFQNNYPERYEYLLRKRIGEI